MKTQMKEIILETMSLERKTSNAWSIYFVYAPEGNFVIKGRNDKVEGYVKENFPRCIYHYTYWRDGKCRGGWMSTVKNFLILSPSHRQGVQRREKEDYNYELYNPRPRIQKYEVSVYDPTRRNPTQTMEFRRIPKKWLPEYDEMISLAKGDPVQLRQFWSLTNLEL